MDATKRNTSLKSLLITALLCLNFCGFAQQEESSWDRLFAPSDTFNKKRFLYAIGTETVVATASLTALYQLWYADYPQSSFHFVNDNRDWLQMDKIGHAMSAYYSGVFGMELMKWTGMPRKKAIWWGGLQGWVFLLGVEIMDGFSEEWGFSMGDFVANTVGAGLAMGQEAIWEEQRILMKFSFSGSRYRELRPDLLGESLYQSWLKDYNGQTYWLSASPGSFSPDSRWPDWLNIAVGYSGMGMLTGDPRNQENMPQFAHIDRQRQFFLSLDLDLRKIPVKSRTLKAIFNTINFIKIPFPALEIREDGSVRGHGIYF